MPDVHALLGPSSAKRWMTCTPSARLGDGIPDRGSDYAREGTLAHRVGELFLRRRWEGADVTGPLAEAQTDPLYSVSMEEHLEAYAAYIEECMAEAKDHCPDPRIFIEQMVKFDEYVPEGFGTSDAIIISDGQLDVIDLKYGKGVPVSAEGNPQMRIYALGCYLALGWAYEIDTVRMHIFQPRLDNISTDTLPLSDLLTWAETELKPKAALAWEGKGEFHPSEETCRWCRAAPLCRANRDYQMELARQDFADPPLLSNEEIAEVLARLPALLSWADRVKDFALDAAVNRGEQFPGFKVVEGRSNRKYTDEDAIAALLRKAGFKVGDIYKPRELFGLTAMEKLVGKKKFGELAGAYIIKPEGAPTLVPESDKRPPLNTAAKAAEDFTDDFKEE